MRTLRQHHRRGYLCGIMRDGYTKSRAPMQQAEGDCSDAAGHIRILTQRVAAITSQVKPNTD